MKTISYVASATGALMHSSSAVVRGIRGPVGSGKSVACINELHRLAVEQWPNGEGIRKTRWAIIRNTTPELRTTTLNTFRQWIPEVLCPITMHPLIMGKLEYPLQDGTSVEAEFLFLALDNDKDVRKLLSLEITGCFINEAREISYAVVKAARERIGRYPSVIDGYQGTEYEENPCRRKSLIMDSNPCDEDHWWYHLAENGYLPGTEDIKQEQAREDTRRVFEFFCTPSPLIKDGSTYKPSPAAENVAHLPGRYQYYLDMIAGNSEDHIHVMVMGNYGAIRDGKPVYPEYSDNIHSGDVQPIRGLPIALGWDFGLTPSCIIGQMTSKGQVRITDELVGDNMSARQFARDVVKPFIAMKYANHEIAFSIGDPAGNSRGEGDGKSAIGILNDDYVNNNDGDVITPLNMGFSTEYAPTNDITRRLDAVKGFLSKLVGNGEPGYQVSTRCKYLRQGKIGKYKYRKLQIPGENKYNEKPDKNEYSHPADAEQYLMLGFTHGYYNITDTEEEYDELETGRDAICGY